MNILWSSHVKNDFIDYSPDDFYDYYLRSDNCYNIKIIILYFKNKIFFNYYYIDFMKIKFKYI